MTRQKEDWIHMIHKMQDIRLFCSLNIRKAKNSGIASAQELDLLSRVALSAAPMTPQELSSKMGLSKSAVSRLIRHLTEQRFLEKEERPEDKRSYLVKLTEKGRKELRQTYQYYLEPVYRLRRAVGEEKFLTLTGLINESNRILQKQNRMKKQEDDIV